jgi:hypothetical protein
MKTKDNNLQGFVRRVAPGRPTRVVDVGFRIVRYSLLEKIGFALQRDHVHEVEWIGDIVHLVIAKGYEEAVSDKFNILAHQCCVHADESTR